MAAKVAMVLWILGSVASADPAPPKEVLDLAKQLAIGTKCSGKVYLPENVVLDVAGTKATKPDYNNWWVRETYESKRFKFDAFTTYDATTKKWRRVIIDNLGGYMTGASDGPKDGRIDFAMEGFGPSGSLQFRDHTDLTDKTQIKSWGERSSDKGKTWVKDYESICKK